MRFPRLASFLVALTLAASSSALAADAGTALAQLKTSHAAAAKTLKADLATARATFLADLKTFEATVKAGGAGVPLAQALFDDLFALQLATRSALQDAFFSTGLAARQALLTLPQPLNGIYPRGFTVGDGGLADQFRVQVDGTIQKHVASLRKRLVKTTTLADKAGVGLTFRIEVPVVRAELRWNEDTVNAANAAALGVDTIMGFSVLDVTGDGRVFVGGHAAAGPTVDVEVSGPMQSITISGVLVSNGRWTTAVDTGEGNHFVDVERTGAAEPFPLITIGVR
jgi:hypothetical protein